MYNILALSTRSYSLKMHIQINVINVRWKRSTAAFRFDHTNICIHKISTRSGMHRQIQIQIDRMQEEQKDKQPKTMSVCRIDIQSVHRKMHSQNDQHFVLMIDAGTPQSEITASQNVLWCAASYFTYHIRSDTRDGFVHRYDLNIGHSIELSKSTVRRRSNKIIERKVK